MHYHVSTGEHASELHIGHLHALDLEDHGHEHDSDFDVSLFELTANWFKQIQNAIIFTLVLILFVTSAIVVCPPKFRNTLFQRHTYWRPVLRGPPALH